jgi:hypothetical protein
MQTSEKQVKLRLVKIPNSYGGNRVDVMDERNWKRPVECPHVAQETKRKD